MGGRAQLTGDQIIRKTSLCLRFTTLLNHPYHRGKLNQVKPQEKHARHSHPQIIPQPHHHPPRPMFQSTLSFDPPHHRSSRPKEPKVPGPRGCAGTWNRGLGLWHASFIPPPNGRWTVGLIWGNGQRAVIATSCWDTEIDRAAIVESRLAFCLRGGTVSGWELNQPWCEASHTGHKEPTRSRITRNQHHHPTSQPSPFLNKKQRKTQHQVLIPSNRASISF